MTIKELRQIIKTNNLDENTEIMIRICGQNDNKPVEVNSSTLRETPYTDNYNGYELVLNCLETEEVEGWEEVE